MSRTTLGGSSPVSAGERGAAPKSLSGHRHVPYVWPIAGMLLIHSGSASTLRTRGFPHPAYNLIHVGRGRIAVELCVPEGERQSLGRSPATGPRT